MTDSNNPPSEAGIDRIGADNGPADAGLEAKARRLLALARWRDTHFRMAVMGDGAMSLMLSLLLAEMTGVPLTPANLALANSLDREEARRLIDALLQGGLVAIDATAPDRRTIGLTPLGAARIRGYVTGHPDV